MRFYCRMKSRVESLAEERQGLRVRFRPSRGGQRAQAWKEAGSSAARAAGPREARGQQAGIPQALIPRPSGGPWSAPRAAAHAGGNREPGAA